MPDPVLDAQGNPVVASPDPNPNLTQTPEEIAAATAAAAAAAANVDNPFRQTLLGMPEELQNDPLLQNFKSVEELARGYSNTKRWADGRVKLPDDKSTPEEVSSFYQRLGVPMKPEEYEFTKVEVSPAVGIDAKVVDEMRPIFHSLKLTKTQADGLQKEYIGILAKQHERLVTEYKTEMAQKDSVLKTRWNDAYASNLELAKRTFLKNANEGLKATVEREGWGNHPDFIELFYNLGVATGEDTFRQGSPMEQTTLDGEIKAVEAELQKVLPAEPRYKELLAKRKALYEKRYPQTQ